MASYLVTGASRGLGLGLCAALAAKPASEVQTIFAAFRTETTGLKKLVSDFPGRVEAVPLDVTVGDSAKKAASSIQQVLGDRGLDVLINSAGVQIYTPNGTPNMNDLDSTLKTNVSSAHYVTSAFLPLLRKGSLKKIINVSSTLGSISLAKTHKQMPFPAYMVSKAALNMLTVQYGLSLEKEGFTVLALSPGWVKTDLGGANADLDIDTSITAVLNIVFNSSEKDNGKFLDVSVPGFNQYSGSEIPW